MYHVNSNELSIKSLAFCPILVPRSFQTRTSAVYALGTFLNTRRKESEHGETIEHKIANSLLKACCDGSVVVRKVGVFCLIEPLTTM